MSNKEDFEKELLCQFEPAVNRGFPNLEWIPAPYIKWWASIAVRTSTRRYAAKPLLTDNYPRDQT
jgi:hypothetical protein